MPLLQAQPGRECQIARQGIHPAPPCHLSQQAEVANDITRSLNQQLKFNVSQYMKQKTADDSDKTFSHVFKRHTASRTG